MIEKGKAVECGSHEELMQKKGAYYKLVETQREAANVRAAGTNRREIDMQNNSTEEQYGTPIKSVETGEFHEQDDDTQRFLNASQLIFSRSQVGTARLEIAYTTSAIFA